MEKRGLGTNKQSWEGGSFPILCENCLGENPYVRMLKAPAHKECKICLNPFINFRWKAGPNGRYKNTEVCRGCATTKKVCQTCLLDLQYHLPVEVRDRFLGEQKVVIPTQEANRNFWAEQVNRNIEHLALPYEEQKGNQVLEKLSKRRSQPYAQRNLPHICSFFVKGECKRGDVCPYRHELPPDNGLANQNIQDRFHGTNDPVAQKMLGRVHDNSRIKPPQNTSISMPIPDVNQDKFIQNIAQIGNVTYYPSMDPNSLGGLRSDQAKFGNKK